MEDLTRYKTLNKHWLCDRHILFHPGISLFLQITYVWSFSEPLWVVGLQFTWTALGSSRPLKERFQVTTPRTPHPSIPPILEMFFWEKWNFEKMRFVLCFLGFFLHSDHSLLFVVLFLWLLVFPVLSQWLSGPIWFLLCNWRWLQIYSHPRPILPHTEVTACQVWECCSPSFGPCIFFCPLFCDVYPHTPQVGCRNSPFPMGAYFLVGYKQ